MRCSLCLSGRCPFAALSPLPAWPRALTDRDWEWRTNLGLTNALPKGTQLRTADCHPIPIVHVKQSGNLPEPSMPFYLSLSEGVSSILPQSTQTINLLRCVRRFLLWLLSIVKRLQIPLRHHQAEVSPNPFDPIPDHNRVPFHRKNLSSNITDDCCCL